MSSNIDNTEIESGNDFDARLQRWLTGHAENKAIKHKGGRKSQGGLRLIVCDRPDKSKIGISRHAFEKIKEVFHLHATTIPTLFAGISSHSLHRSTDENGVTLIHIIIKAMPDTPMYNCLLSLTYN